MTNREWALRILKAATGIDDGPPESIVSRVEKEVEAFTKEVYQEAYARGGMSGQKFIRVTDIDGNHQYTARVLVEIVKDPVRFESVWQGQGWKTDAAAAAHAVMPTIEEFVEWLARSGSVLLPEQESVARALFTMPRGSGKTWLLRRLFDFDSR